MLQKTSNKFLQQALPENPMVNKPIGKRKEYRPFPRTVGKKINRMESSLLKEWLLSWNILKAKMQQQSGDSGQGNVKEEVFQSIKLYTSLARIPRKWMRSQECCNYLIAPAFSIANHGINRAVGGNLIQHLNEYTRNGRTGAISSGNWAGGVVENNCQDGKCKSHQLVINSTPYHLTGRGSVSVSLAQFFTIYSLDEKSKVSKRRDKISDDYRNQIAEWRKIALLYGNLPRRTIVRVMRQANQLGGNVDSNFLSLLERRLDVTLKRAFFFSTIKGARQWIERGKICVNDQQITFPSYLLQPADLITIKNEAQSEWKKVCLGTFARIREREFFYENRRIKRRFPFSPTLMRKWKDWSHLWGNSCWTPSKRHQWPSSLAQSSPYFFSSSSFANYFSHLKKKEYKQSPILEKTGGGVAATNLYPFPLLSRRKSTVGGSLNKPRRGINQRVKRTDHQKNNYCSWLCQQQSSVVDGLFPLRWNKALATEKTSFEKKEIRRWSCLKPLHLECSYKHYAIIFLYSPQKLAWPCSIKVSLLKKGV